MLVSSWWLLLLNVDIDEGIGREWNEVVIYGCKIVFISYKWYSCKIGKEWYVSWEVEFSDFI